MNNETLTNFVQGILSGAILCASYFIITWIIDFIKKLSNPSNSSKKREE